MYGVVGKVKAVDFRKNIIELLRLNVLALDQEKAFQILKILLMFFSRI